MKTLSALLVLILSNSVYASELLQGYECKNSDEAMQCNSSCSRANYKLEFKVNERTNQVIRFSYIDKKFIQSVSFKNCSVVDKKNWLCESADDVTISTIVMRNGQYSHMSFVTDKYKNAGLDLGKNFCAK